eukprot:Sspe_Gene.13744::Locus_4721_Transcript_1_1_Confidence_1.000_Length_5612::g.13744::m.13744
MSCWTSAVPTGQAPLLLDRRESGTRTSYYPARHQTLPTNSPPGPSTLPTVSPLPPTRPRQSSDGLALDLRKDKSRPRRWSAGIRKRVESRGSSPKGVEWRSPKEKGLSSLEKLLESKVTTLSQLEEQVISPLLKELAPPPGRPFSFCDFFLAPFGLELQAKGTSHPSTPESDALDRGRAKADQLEMLNELLMRHSMRSRPPRPSVVDAEVTAEINDDGLELRRCKEELSAARESLRTLKRRVWCLSALAARAAVTIEVLRKRILSQKMEIVLLTEAIDERRCTTHDASAQTEQCERKRLDGHGTTQTLKSGESMNMTPCLSRGVSFTTNMDWEELSVPRVESFRHLSRYESFMQGEVALVFTDVQNSTALWNKDLHAMRTAMQFHNELMRSTLTQMGGYEVKTEGDAFMVSFRSPADACRFCCEVQMGLMAIDWPEGILGVEGHTDEVKDAVSGEVIFRGLRVRMGYHTGTPLQERDPTTGRIDFFGPVVNYAARVAAKGHGGEIVISEAAHLDCYDGVHDAGVVALELGVVGLKGFEPQPLYHIFPTPLAPRANYYRIEEPWTPQRLPLSACGGGTPQPVGGVTLVVTEVASSPSLRACKAMAEAIELHNHILRGLGGKHKGHEVKNEGDAFVFAFQFPEDAVAWALEGQLALLSAPWPDELLEHPLASPSLPHWRGLRVRMGVMQGWGSQGEYTGGVKPPAHGGEIVVTPEVFDALPALPHDASVREIAGAGYSILPTQLAPRFDSFDDDLTKSLNSPHVLLAFNAEMQLTVEAVRHEAPSGVVTFLGVAAAQATELYNTHPNEMAKDVAQLHECYLSLVKMCSGYVVHLDADFLIAAFADRDEALHCAEAIMGRMRGVEVGGGRMLELRAVVNTGKASQYVDRGVMRMVYGGQVVKDLGSLLLGTGGGELVTDGQPVGPAVHDDWGRFRDLTRLPLRPVPPLNHDVTLVIIDVHESEQLWRGQRRKMEEVNAKEALRMKELLQHQGWFVAWEGDAAVLVFPKTAQAVGWAVNVQRGDKVQYRIAIHRSAAPTVKVSEWGAVTYHGSLVHDAVSALALSHPGEVVCTADAFARITSFDGCTIDLPFFPVGDDGAMVCRVEPFLTKAASPPPLPPRKLYTTHGQLCSPSLFPGQDRKVVLMAADIHNSIALWTEDPSYMRVVVRKHVEVFHGLVQKHGGHVVRIEAEAVLAAFQDPTAAFAVAHAVVGRRVKWGGTTRRGDVTVRVGIVRGMLAHPESMLELATVVGAARGGEVVCLKGVGKPDRATPLIIGETRGKGDSALIVMHPPGRHPHPTPGDPQRFSHFPAVAPPSLPAGMVGIACMGASVVDDNTPALMARAREAVVSHNGHIAISEGASMLVLFPSLHGAFSWALCWQQQQHDGRLAKNRFQVAVHYGEITVLRTLRYPNATYSGKAMRMAADLAAWSQNGDVVISQEAAALLDLQSYNPSKIEILDRGISAHSICAGGSSWPPRIGNPLARPLSILVPSRVNRGDAGVPSTYYRHRTFLIAMETVIMQSLESEIMEGHDAMLDGTRMIDTSTVAELVMHSRSVEQTINETVGTFNKRDAETKAALLGSIIESKGLGKAATAHVHRLSEMAAKFLVSRLGRREGSSVKKIARNDVSLGQLTKLHGKVHRFVSSYERIGDSAEVNEMVIRDWLTDGVDNRAVQAKDILQAIDSPDHPGTSATIVKSIYGLLLKVLLTKASGVPVPAKTDGRSRFARKTALVPTKPFGPISANSLFVRGNCMKE